MMMSSTAQHWEYLIVKSTDGGVSESIGELGKEGWELVSVSRGAVYVDLLYFKRPIDSPTQQ